MPRFELPPLPFAQDALAPVISVSTMERHYGKHHKAYVDKTNALIEGTPFADMSLEEIIVESARAQTTRALMNNAAQTWNHTRYWESLSPDGGAPSDQLAERIERDLGGMDKFKEEIVKKGVGHFASGWVWLTFANGKLNLIDTHDADCALLHGQDPLLVLDVWEHAYYLDYQNERERHLRTVAQELLNWRGASARLAALTGA